MMITMYPVPLLPLIALLLAAPAEEVHWHSEWRAAQRVARQENKPIFAVLACRH